MYTFKFNLPRNTIEEIIDFSRLNLELIVVLFFIFIIDCFWECYIKIDEKKFFSGMFVLQRQDSMTLITHTKVNLSTRTTNLKTRENCLKVELMYQIIDQV